MATATAGLLLLVAAVTPAQGQGRAQRTGATVLAPGVAHEVWTLPGSTARVHVARRSPGGTARLQLVQAHDAADGGLETTSAMCRRTRGCQVAVNGDFFTAGGAVGGVVVDSRMVRSPTPGHEQLSLEPLRATDRGLGDGGWTGQVAQADGTRALTLDGVNVPLAAGRLVLYTSQHGPETPACTCVEVRLAEESVPAGTLGRPAPATVTGQAHGRTPLAPGVAVLAAEGTAADALGGLVQAARVSADRDRLVVTVSVSQPTAHNVGAHPVLLRDGRPQAYDRADPMLADPHPRTLVGWDAAGTVWLVTAEGRREGGPGLTAQQAVAFLRQLGATEAVMLDGGGSSTFAVRGRVVNAPSDGVERPVANAVVLAWQRTAAVRTAPPPSPPVLEEAAAVAPVPLALPPVAPAAPPAAAPAAPAPAAPVSLAPVPDRAPAPVVVEPPAAAPAPRPTVVDPFPEQPAVAAPPLRAAAEGDPRPVPATLLACLLCVVALGAWLRVVVAGASSGATQGEEAATEGM